MREYSQPRREPRPGSPAKGGIGRAPDLSSRREDRARPAGPDPAPPGARAGRYAPAAAASRTAALGAGAVFLAALLLFAPTLGHGFVWDDLSILLPNPLLGDWSRLGEALTSDFFNQPEARREFDYWRPLVVLTHMAESSLFGRRPAGYHGVNVLLHATTSALVFLLALRALGGALPALAAGLVFAVHPVHVEVVAWVSGRSDLLLGLCLALALLGDWQAARTGRRRWRAVALGAFLAALLAKESAAVFPLLVAARSLLAGESGAGARRRAARAAREALPALLVLTGYLALRYGLLEVAPPAAGPPPDGRLALFWTWWSALWLYARLLVWPSGLSIAHRLPLAAGPLDWAVAAGLLVLAGAVWAAVRLRRAEPAATFGLLVLLAGLAPLTNFLIRIASHGEAAFPVAERFLYSPSIGFCLFAGWLLGRAVPRLLTGGAGPGGERIGGGSRPAERSHARPLRDTLPAILIGALVLAGATSSALRARVWKDEATLFAATVDQAPGSAMARLNYGVALIDLARGEASPGRRTELLDRARHHLEAAAELAPDNYRAHYDLGNLYLALGWHEAARSAFLEALRIRPDLFPAMLNLGGLLARDGRPAEALEWLDRAARMQPANVAVMVNRAHVLQELGRPGEAIPLYRRALSADPGLSAARAGLERALEAQAEQAAAGR